MNGRLHRTNGKYAVTIDVVNGCCEISVTGDVPKEVARRKEELNHIRIDPSWVMNQLFKATH